MEASSRSNLYAGCLTAAIAVGVVLGHSTVSAINPAHFRTATAPRGPGGAVQSGTPEPVPLYRAQFSREEALLVRAGVCPGCDTQFAGQGFVHAAAVPYFGSREERAAVEARERSAIDAAYAQREQRRETAREHAGVGGAFEPETGDEAANASPDSD